MASYKLRFRSSVSKDLRRLPAKDVAKLLRVIQSLAENPRPPGSEKLSGQERYRVRQGNYRVVYEIFDDELLVIVVKVGHRRNIYRGARH